jgi:hypothetical protein
MLSEVNTKVRVNSILPNFSKKNKKKKKNKKEISRGEN